MPDPQDQSAQSPQGYFDKAFAQAEQSESSGRNEAALAKYPSNIRTQAKGLADYRITISPFALTKPYWQQAIQAAQEYDPTFDQSQYAIRQGVKKDFTSGATSKALTSLNTAIGHLDSLKDAAAKLNNFSSVATPLNGPVNWAESELGDPRVNNFNERANAVSTELTRAFRGSGGAEADVQAWRKNLPVNGSPDQQKEAIDGAIDLLSSRVGALKDQYQKGLGKPADFNFLNPKARSILTGMGYDPDKIEGGMKASDARLGQAPASDPVNVAPPPKATSATTPDPASHYVPGHIYGGKTFTGPAVDHGVNDPANWK